MSTAQFVGEMQTVVASSSITSPSSAITVQQAGGGNSNTPTVVQVSGKGQVGGQPTIIQQNGQQFIITTTSKLGNVAEQAVSNDQNVSEAIALPGTAQTVQTVYPVQYIETSDPTVYAAAAANNGQIEYIEINSGKPVTKAVLAASSKSGQYQNYDIQYAAGANTGTTYYQNAQGQLREVANVPQLSSNSVPPGTQIVMHQGSTFLLQGATLDEQGTAITHTTRASPATVQWLIDNYETAEGVSLPRSTLYNHYLRHCHEQKIDPMNPASFGKLIRSVFLGLRTRRLGTRGNSKYHYYGIRIKPSSPLNQFQDDQSFAMRHYPFTQSKRYKSVNKYETDMVLGTGGGAGLSGGNLGMGAGGGVAGGGAAGLGGLGAGGMVVPEEAQQHQQFLGDASSALPSLGEVHIPEGCSLPDGITEDDVQNFVDLYMEHCESILDTVVNLQFSLVEMLWQQFWRTGTTGDMEADKKLPKDTLTVLCSFAPVRDFVRDSDYTFYQSLVEVLIPAVLRPIPSSLTQAIRNFAKSLEGWMRAALKGGIDEEMVRIKLSAVTAFAQTLRRYTSLNHLAQAARAVLTNTSQINQMLTDLNRVDFANVQEQASWVCHCDDRLVVKLEQDFKKILQQQTSLEQWAGWLDGVVTTVLQPHEGRPEYPRAARQFLLKWSFYSSMVIRDLTLRSAASFGSFHLIRLLYDEYMFFLVEHKVAVAMGQTPVAVMGELGKNPDLEEVPDTRELSGGDDLQFRSASSAGGVVGVTGGGDGESVDAGTVIQLKPDDSGALLEIGNTSSTSGASSMPPPPTIATAKTISTPDGNKTLVVLPPDPSQDEKVKRIKLAPA